MSSASEPRVNGAAAAAADRVVSLPARDRVLGVRWDARSKEAELNCAIFTYAARCLVEGDIDALRQIGFEPTDVQILDELRLSDLHALSASRAHALDVRVNRESLRWLVEHVRRRRTRDMLRLELLRLDAPSEMMTKLFGMTGRSYTAIREALGIVGGQGRPSSHLGNEDEEERLWALWVRLADPERPTRLRQDDLWLVIGRELAFGLRSAWTIIQQWAGDPHSVRSLKDECTRLGRKQIERDEAALRERHSVHATSIHGDVLGLSAPRHRSQDVSPPGSSSPSDA
jgi:hypothetical protein